VSKPIDITKMKKDDTIIVKDGRRGLLKNLYMSPTGVMAIIKTDIAGPCDQNIPVSEIEEHREKGT